MPALIALVITQQATAQHLMTVITRGVQFVFNTCPKIVKSSPNTLLLTVNAQYGRNGLLRPVIIVLMGRSTSCPPGLPCPLFHLWSLQIWKRKAGTPRLQRLSLPLQLRRHLNNHHEEALG